MQEDKNSFMDATDKRILEILWQDGRSSMKDIGNKVHLTGQAVKNRVDRMVSLGVIQQYTVKLNCPVYGYRIHALINLSIRIPGRTSFVDAIRRSNYRLEHCYQVTGAQAYFMDCYFRDEEELKKFIKEIEKYGSYEIQLVLQEILPMSLEEYMGQKKEQRK